MTSGASRANYQALAEARQELGTKVPLLRRSAKDSIPSTARLAAYWAEALGGPTTYSDSYGDETSVVRMHSGHGQHEEMDRRAIACFDQALADIGLASDDRLRQVLYDYFALATTTTMSRFHRSADDVPDELRIPRWSWDGAVSGTGPDVL